jgi:hypothetical protein
MLSARAKRNNTNTNAMAKPKRPLRAGLVGLDSGSGVTQATRRLAV